MANDGKRVIERNSCSWCGHLTHDEKCPSTIQVDTKNQKPIMKPCPCARRLHVCPTCGLKVNQFHEPGVTISCIRATGGDLG